MQFSVNILTARDRSLQQLNINVPERPYWRLWWNDSAGVSIKTDAGCTPMTPEQIVLLAPETHFTPSIQQRVHHFYLHFQLAAPFDLAAPGAYAIPVTPRIAEDLKIAKASLRRDRRQRILVLSGLISEVCGALPKTVWQDPTSDPRLLRVLDAMESHQNPPLSNAELAAIARMAQNAFVRLFSRHCGVSPQVHYLAKRLDRASIMLEYEDLTIEQVAEACGFCDRNYFSTVFRKHLGVPPAQFRRDCQRA